MITTELACRLMLRGICLSEDGEYENPKIKEIAIKESILYKELEKLEKEFWAIAEKEGYNYTWVLNKTQEEE